MITYAIIILTVIVSIACFNSTTLFNALSFKPYRISQNREWYRIITHGFVHGDYMHLIINMLVFYSFGTYVESFMGELHRAEVIGHTSVNYLLLYFGGMVFGTLRDLIKNRHNPNYTSIGASAAVSAVVFTSIFFNPWGKILFFGIIPIPGILFGILYLAYSQCSARRGGDNVNHYAHFFGAVYGFIFPLFMNPSLIYEFLSHFVFE